MKNVAIFIALTMWIIVCSRIIMDAPCKTIWPWTKQPTPINIQELDEIISSANPGDTIVVSSDGTMYRIGNDEVTK